MLGNAPNAEANAERCRRLSVALHELQMQVIEAGLPMVYGHQRSGLLTTKLGYFSAVNATSRISPGERVTALLEFNGWLALSRNCPLQRAGDGLRGKILQVCINRQARSRVRQGELRVDCRVFERDLTVVLR